MLTVDLDRTSVGVLDGHLRRLRALPAHGNRTLFYDQLFVALLLSFYNPTTRSLRLIEDCGGYVTDTRRLIMGGSMMGLAFEDDREPLVKASNCIIVTGPGDLHPRGDEMPCIRCGDCSDVCPASLLPQQLHWYARAHDLPALESLGLMDCIECGCCDYVCPSQIPLTQRFREAKVPVQARLVARLDALASRARYEARGERLARIEQEHRARLEEKRRQLTGRKPAP